VKVNKLDNKLKKQEVKCLEKAISEIFNEYALIEFAPSDEYDCLIHQIISRLHDIKSCDELAEFIAVELQEHFGFIGEKNKVTEIARKVFSLI
jgi:hypothetical protein